MIYKRSKFWTEARGSAIRRKNFLRRLKIFLIVLLFVFVGIFLFADFRIKPVLKTISCSKAKIIATEVINGAIIEDMRLNREEYENISVINTGSNGEVLSVSLNMCRINGLKSRINLLMQKKLFESNERVFYIALGTLMGWEIFNGQGIKIPVNISSSGSVNSDFRSEFSEAGINQTVHRVYLDVKARISVMIPGNSCVTETETSMLISETVIVGNTPQMCTGVSPKCVSQNLEEKKNN